MPHEQSEPREPAILRIVRGIGIAAGAIAAATVWSIVMRPLHVWLTGIIRGWFGW